MSKPRFNETKNAFLYHEIFICQNKCAFITKCVIYHKNKT